MKEILKYQNLIETEIRRDEEGQGGASHTENPTMENDTRFTLGDLLKMFGGDDDTAYVSLVKKLHELLGQAGKKGLDDEGKKAIDDCVQDLNKYAPKIGPLVQRSIQQYGYDLDVEIPIEAALGGYFVFVGVRMNSTRNQFLKAQESKNDQAGNQGGREWR